MKNVACRLLIVSACLVVSSRAQQNKGEGWSWQTPDDFFGSAPKGGADDAKPAVNPPPDVDPPPERSDPEELKDAENDLDWMWEEELVEQDLGEAPMPRTATVVGAVKARSGGGAIDVSAYDELLQENLDLRREADRAGSAQEKLRGENLRLSREVKDLEARVQEFAALVKDLEKGAPPTGVEDAATVTGLKIRLAEALAVNQKLTREVATLRGEATAARPQADGAGSDLLRRVKADNARLKEELARTVAAKAGRSDDKQEEALRRARESEVELRRKLAEAEAKEQKHRRVVEKVLTQIPHIEEQMASLKAEVAKKDAALKARGGEFEALHQEVARREHRIVHSEKVADGIDTERRDVRNPDKRQQRDMCYNMAIVLAKEGHFQEAERQYLQALRIDPTDAEVHYNLGILYDDELGDKQRAAAHYRRFLRLNPSGPDADVVREWLMQIEPRKP